jgi:Ubiquitin elongating factor core
MESNGRRYSLKYRMRKGKGNVTLLLPDLRREREQTHTHSESQAKAVCVLANETMDLLAFFTAHVKAPFLEGGIYLK